MDKAAKTNWKIDQSHSEVQFKIKHMMISTVSGNFDSFDANVESDNDNFINADFSLSAEIDSIDTKNSDRDAHLKSDDFFNAAEFPQLTFKSKSFDGSRMIGDLTIRNITKEIVLDAEFNGIADDMYGQTKAGFTISGSLSRKDFDLRWNGITEAGNVVVSDNVKLVLDLQFVKQA